MIAAGAVAVAGLAARPAVADEEGIVAHREELPHVVVGMRFGLLPPVLSLLEVGFRVPDNPNSAAPAVTLSLAGAVAPGDWAIGDGGLRTSVGGFLGFESRNASGWYASLGYLHYRAAPSSTGYWETDDFGYVTFGWLRRLTYADFFIGGGLIALLAEDRPPCTSFCVELGGPPPPILPTFDLGFRFHAAPRAQHD